MWFSCFKAKRLMRLYSDDAPERIYDMLHGHLEKCCKCAHEIKELKGLHESFRGLKRYRAPYGFSKLVIGRISGPGQKETGRRFIILTGTAEAVAVVLIVALGIISGDFLAAGIVHDKGANASEHMLIASSSDMFDPTEPDSAERDYLSVTEDVNE